MKYRKLGNTNLEVSEVGFGVWTVATNWWGKIDADQGIGLLTKAYDLGINLFDTADTYGPEYGEEILAKALKTQRHDIVIATKFGYDFYANQDREGHQERPQNWTPNFIKYACEQSLRRLDTDYIDFYQLHNPKMDALENDDVFETLDKLVEEGKIRFYGAAIGPDIGWFEEGEFSMRERNLAGIQIIYSILEQEPARSFFPIAQEQTTGLLSRVPHASGLLDGTYTKDTVFDSSDHRSHRRREWLETGLKKLQHLDFLMENLDATIAQIAIKFVLSAPQIASVLPNITNQEQLAEFAASPETEEIPEEFIAQLHELFDEHFYIDSLKEASPAD